jgi:hypothetical protein
MTGPAPQKTSRMTGADIDELDPAMEDTHLDNVAALPPGAAWSCITIMNFGVPSQTCCVGASRIWAANSSPVPSREFLVVLDKVHGSAVEVAH